MRVFRCVICSILSLEVRPFQNQLGGFGQLGSHAIDGVVEAVSKQFAMGLLPFGRRCADCGK